jgi:hypothetical protein
MQKFSSIGLGKYINDLRMQNDKKKCAIPYLKLQLARIECLRDENPLDDPSFAFPQESPFPVDVIDDDEGYGLPLGPMMHLQLSRNIFLERMLTFDEEIDTSCVACHDPIRSGESVLLSCDCPILICKNCALSQLIASKTTYKNGVKSPTCRECSVISYEGIERERSGISGSRYSGLFSRRREKTEFEVSD